MKKWIVRFLSLLVFNVVVLLVIGLITSANVGWSALWAGIVMTLLVLWVKPLITKAFTNSAAKSASTRTRLGEKVVQVLIVLAVAAIVWVATVFFSGVRFGGFWGWVLPPVIIAIGWVIYDLIDDKVEARAGDLYDRVTGGRNRADASTAAPTIAPPNPAVEAGRRELHDGLTDEQRRMLDELGKS